MQSAIKHIEEEDDYRSREAIYFTVVAQRFTAKDLGTLLLRVIVFFLVLVIHFVELKGRVILKQNFVKYLSYSYKSRICGVLHISVLVNHG